MGTLATLFTGGGGFECGAMAAGLTPIWGVEYDAEIAGVYARNFGPHVIVSGVESVDYATLTRPDWLHMSPVCTNASVAKKDGEETREDKSAAWSCCLAIEVLQPETVSLENVWGYRKFESFQMILAELRRWGYKFNYWHLNAADYGVPQTRKRLILLASKSHQPRKPPQTHSERGASAQQCLFGSAPLLKWEGWYKAIEDLIPTLPESKFAEWQLKRLPYGLGTFVLSNSKTEFSEGVREGDEPMLSVTVQHKGRVRAFSIDGKPSDYEGSELKFFEGESPDGTLTATQTRHPFRAFVAHPSADNPRFVVRTDNEPIWTQTNTAGVMGGTRAFLVGGANTSDEQAAEGVGVSDSLQPSRCVNASNSAHWRAWLEHGRVVSMTPRALVRFQSFPDSYVLPEKSGLACKVIGNAVPALLAQRVVESVISQAQREAA